MPERILILGGGFDPFHLGHLRPPQSVKRLLGFDLITYVPTGVSPHKRHKKVTDPETRLRIIELSLEDETDVAVDTFELRAGRVCYFYETVEHLAQKHPDAKLAFMVGTDWAGKLERWRRFSRILELAEPICASRSGFGEIPSNFKYRVVTVETPNVSGTTLRERLSRGLYDDELVRSYIKPKALDFIRQRRLYEDVNVPAAG